MSQITHINEHVNGFELASSAWSIWSQIEAKDRCKYLHSYFSSLDGELQKAALFQLRHGMDIVDYTYQFPGPTGESNELYTAGRGVAILVIDSDESGAALSAIAHLAAILLAGNSVIICSDRDDLVMHLSLVLKEADLAANLVQFLPLGEFRELLVSDIRSFTYIGHHQAEIEINKLLAERTGVITTLVSETDFERFPSAQDPKLVLRFVTERTRTINITAVGGNATLLELGSDSR